MKHSIHARVLISALVILVLFMSLTGFVLDEAFRNNAEKSQQENLRTQIYALLANAELDDENNNLTLPEEITEPRLNIIDSNLHARVISANNQLVWQSKSLFNFNISVPTDITAGEFYFSKVRHDEQTYTALNFSTLWISDRQEKQYIFQIIENRNVLDAQISLFRKNLWGWLAGISFLLVIIQMFILRWGLTPLRHVANDLSQIEQGHATKLSDNYVKEITPLTNNLNQLLESSSQQLTRYRDALGNMAHSLKTPIAVLQGIVSSFKDNDKKIANEQIETINNIINYQLQRASTAGKTRLSGFTNVYSIADKIINALEKVYKDKNVEVKYAGNKDISIKIEQGDLYELLGNVIENAFKWCNKKINVSVEKINGQVRISIEDDGPGIDDKIEKRILIRGQRADENTPGHGLGLAMVKDMLLLYDGSLEFKKSNLGGAGIIITM